MRTSSQWLLPLAAALVLSSAAPRFASASHITLDLRPTAVFRDGRASVTVRIVNRGDEPACALRLEAAAGGPAAFGATLDTLEPGGSAVAETVLPGLPQPAGVHTVRLALRYTDAAGRPFTALGSVPLLTGDPGDALPALLLTVRPVDLARAGAATVTVTSRAAVSVTARVRLVLPDEIRGAGADWELSLPPGGSDTHDLPLSNVRALPGSSYAVIAVADAVVDGRHTSTAAYGRIRIVAPPHRRAVSRHWALAAILPLLALAALAQWPRRPAAVARLAARLNHPALVDGLVLAGATAFVLLHLSPPDLLRNTLTVGGDTPAHSYLLSHLRDQLAHGRIVSWAGGWWCGFPMFQYYFCLPYVLAALLSLAIPLNVAFKLVSVLGLLALPACAYASGRAMRLPRPVPALLAVAAMPFLFDRSHTMWGVNVYSTLAGMIANSISFAIMVLYLGRACRDAEDGRFRLRTVFLLVALLASHFFTSVVAGLTAALLPFLRRPSRWVRAGGVLAAEWALAALLMAWWIVPLFAKREFSMDFGTDWTLRWRELLTAPAVLALPLAAVGAALGLRRRAPAAAMLAWMLAVSGALLVVGQSVSPVFVNVRLWPFVTWASLALAAVGAGLALARAQAAGPAVFALLAAALAYGPGRPNHAAAWAQWNYEGLQAKAGWPDFARLVLPLDATPGRLANDLHEANNLLGSSRIFECVPALIDKPILEGGLVNSAVGSLYAYYVQGETSKNCAGFPTMLRPATFDITNATRHLELLNVKHFVARWEGTRQALAAHPAWRRVDGAGGWELFELTTHDGAYVEVPAREPIRLATSRWKEQSLEWLYTPELLDQPVAFVPPGTPGALDDAAYSNLVAAARARGAPAVSAEPTERAVSAETVTDGSIRFRTSAIGRPHLVKCSYYPNWKVRGADGVLPVTPGFMLVYPTQADVELYYGRTASDNAGHALTLTGALAVLAIAWLRRRGTTEAPWGSTGHPS